MPALTKEKPVEATGAEKKDAMQKMSTKKTPGAKKAPRAKKTPAEKKVSGAKGTARARKRQAQNKSKAVQASAQKPAQTQSESTTKTPGVPRSFKDFNPWDKIIRPAKPVEDYTNKEVGTEGERLAALYLEYKGYDIITMNWTSRMGEVDIVARQDDALVLCEVKTRVCLEEKNVFPELKVDAAKQKKYRQLALQYLIEHPEEDSVRFDVMALVITGQQNARLRHLINAFCFDAEG